MQRRPLKLRFLLAASITLLALVITTVVSFTIGRTGVDRVEREIGLSLAMLADQMQDKLDRGLFERIREINNMAAILADGHDSGRSQPVRQWLDLMQSTFPDYVWIGLADHTGLVKTGTNGLREGQNVVHETWFKSGLKGAIFGDVHGAGPLARLLPAQSSGAARLIDVAAPVNVRGQIHGVLGAHLSWNWAKEVQDSLFGSIGGNRTIEALVVGGDGAVLLGPPEILGKPLAVTDMREQTLGPRRYSVGLWPDGKTYLSGYAEIAGYPQFGGLGWNILVRQNADVALAPVAHLRQRILTWSAVFVTLSALLAWLLAGWLAAPMLRLAASADRLRRGEPTTIPYVGGYAEAEVLSNSLRTLFDELKHREARLSELNVSLEHQVADRTRKLEKRNVQLAAAKEKAEEATRSKSRFLAAASHDLRQPLHALTLFARALSRRVEGAEAKGLVAQTEEALASLKEMFDALLNVSRLDAGLIQPNLQAVSLAEVVGRVSAGFTAEAEHRGLSFRSHVVDAVVRTDPILLETMLRNLVSNAMKFTRKGGVILAVRTLRGRIAIQVYDTGPGITAEAQERIFQEFQRSSVTAYGANDGLGLGLSIVDRYAKLLGVKIDLSSRPGHGTRFTLLMPASEIAGRALAATAPRLGGPCALKNHRILVLDDEPLIVESLARDLSDRGNTVLRANSVMEAETQIAATGFPDAAVVDINLSAEESGPQFVARIEQLHGRVLPTLVLTGATDAETLAELMQSRRKWLTKPADPDMIAAVLADLVAEPQTAVQPAAPAERTPAQWTVGQGIAQPASKQTAQTVIEPVA